MSLIDKLEGWVAKVDTEYQEKMEAVIREQLGQKALKKKILL